jgi:hypothetical protein
LFLVGSGGIEPLAIGHCFTDSLDTMSWSGPETRAHARNRTGHTAYEAALDHREAWAGTHAGRRVRGARAPWAQRAPKLE